MADIESIIATASGIGDSGGDSGGGDTGGDTAVDTSAPDTSTTESSDGLEDSGSSSAEATTPTEPAPPITPASEPTDADKILAAEGIQAKGKNGKDNNIPYSRVRSIVENAKKKWADEQGGQIQELQAKVQNFDVVEQMAASDPDRFISLLAEQNPAYKKFLANGGAAAAPAPSPADRASQAPADDQMPGPDYDLGNGARTYSPDGLTKLLEWQARRVRQEVIAEVDKSYKPVRDSFEQQRMRASEEERVSRELAEATSWPGFVDFQDEIRQTYLANPRMTLHQAYIKVVPNKFKADRESIEKETRAKVLEEMKAAPASTAVTATATAPKGDTAGERTTEQIIRDSIKRLK